MSALPWLLERKWCREEVVHHRADAIDADLRILDLAVPQPPAQALDLLDDHRLRDRALRTLGRQASGNLRQVLQPHGDMKPVEDRKPRDAIVEKNAPQPGTAVGNDAARGQHLLDHTQAEWEAEIKP